MKKFVKKTLSIALALVMCAGMVAPAFAASFADLQDAINADFSAPDVSTSPPTTDDTRNNGDYVGRDENGNNRYGYSWSRDEKTNKWSAGIEAWDDGDTRNVQLNEDVVHANDKDAPQIETEREEGSLVLDLNTHKIDGQNSNTKIGSQQIIVAGGTTTIKNGTITGSTGSGILMHTAYNPNTDIDLTLENLDVYGNAGRGASLMSHKDSSNNLTMTNVNIHDNGDVGLFLQDFTFNVKDSKIIGNGKSDTKAIAPGIQLGGGAKGSVTNTEISGNSGRGFFMASNTEVTLDNVDIHGNAGGILVAGKLTLKNSSIVDNHAPETAEDWTQNTDGGGIWVKAERELTIGDGNEIHSNTSSAGASDIYAQAGATVNGLNKTPKAPEGKQFDGWYTENGKGNEYKGPAEIADDVDLVGNLSDAPENPTPVVPGDGYIVDTDDAAEDPDETEIADPAVPLAAGPVTRAEFIDYLWRHEGEPASDGVCTFTDVPEDHTYVLALAWAETNGVAVAYDDGTFEPDELVTVSAVREFLGNFADVFGKQAVAAANLKSLTGADDEAVLNCDEVLAEFFGE